MKQCLIVLVVLGLLSTLIIGCGESGTTSNSPNTVHTQGANFVQSSITISKGSMLTLVDDDATLHIIANGSWVNGVPTPASESGAPSANNMQLSNNGSIQIGPFNTAGTHHLYCTIHHDMNLTVQVQ